MPETEKLVAIASMFRPQQKVAIGKWFGKPCLQVEKRVFFVLWGRDLAFKLAGQAHAAALRIEGAHLFDPRGKGHPMKEWVQIPASQSAHWAGIAKLAFDYVSTLQDD